MAGRDAAAFIRRRRLIMSLPSPRIGTERTCHPSTARLSNPHTEHFPDVPRRPGHVVPDRRLRTTVHAERAHLSAPRLHARHLAVPAHLPSSAPSSRQPLTFAQTPRTV